MFTCCIFSMVVASCIADMLKDMSYAQERLGKKITAVRPPYIKNSSVEDDLI